MPSHFTAPRFLRRLRARAMLAALLFALAACADSVPAGGEFSPLVGGGQEAALDDLSALEPYDPEDVLDIAYGEADGVRWRLFVMVASPDGINGFLCLLTTQGLDQEPMCHFDMEGFFGDPPALGIPSRTAGTPEFVFGSLGPQVTRVEVEVEAGPPVEAEIVGERRAHYVAVLSQGASPVRVVAYDASGRELARRPFPAQITPMGDIVDYFDDGCDYTDEGSEFCEGGVTVGGVVGGNEPHP